jgi:hypothetical protein
MAQVIFGSLHRYGGSVASVRRMNGLNARVSFTAMLLYASSSLCVGQTRGAVCSNGFGSFEEKFTTNVTVSVGAEKNGEMARGACAAKLRWNKESLPIEQGAWQLDIDAMGIDLGLGEPVVAFQVKGSDADSLVDYKIYSLGKPPRLLRTITGGGYFNAADTDLDGRVEIWTNDAKAVDGFEGLPVKALDFAPPVVLRFEHQRLVDASYQFRSYYDRQIASVRAQLDAKQLSEFKGSDGKFSGLSKMPMEQARSLMSAKTRVLEIIWCYLYSGREDEAWQTLTDMWPAADVERIRASIVNAKSHGILSGVDGVAEKVPRGRLDKHVLIFDREPDPGSADLNKTFRADTYPIPILMQRPLPSDGQPDFLHSMGVVEMVIDSAGKVRSAKAVGAPDKDLIAATSDWKFIPAFKNGRAVASRLRYGVTPNR